MTLRMPLTNTNYGFTSGRDLSYPYTIIGFSRSCAPNLGISTSPELISNANVHGLTFRSHYRARVFIYVGRLESQHVVRVRKAFNSMNPISRPDFIRASQNPTCRRISSRLLYSRCEKQEKAVIIPVRL